MSNIDWLEFSKSYLNLINTKFAGLNLTAHKTEEEIYTKQVMDSISPIDMIPSMALLLSQAEYIVDLGTGGGFPLLPMAKHYPQALCVGIDARDKKLKAVQEIAQDLGLSNVKTIHARFDELIFDKISTVALVKAVGKIDEIIDQIYADFPLDIFFYKGINFYNLEIEQLEKLKNNGQLVSIFEISFEGFEKRLIIHCRLSKKVPRGTRDNKQKKIFSKLV